MNSYTVSSIPLNDVIADLAAEMSTPHQKHCGIQEVEIPQSIGSGSIQGVNFPDGLGIVLYDCIFHSDTLIEFHNNGIHPLKFLYSIEGKMSHSFLDGAGKYHNLERFRNIIVASRKGCGHALQFYSGVHVQMYSVEINRRKFWEYIDCGEDMINDISHEILKDIYGENFFFHEGDYTLEIADILNDLAKFKSPSVLKKFFYASKASEIFVRQTRRYRSSQKNGSGISHSQIDDVKKASELIKNDLPKYSTISAIVSKVGTPHHILQKKFRSVYNMTLNEYIMEKRMDEMMYYLENTCHPIKEIAQILGIKSPSYLSKRFKERFGVSPAEFRKAKISN